MGNYILRHIGWREHICSGASPHHGLSFWGIQGVQNRGSENTYLPSSKEGLCLSTSDIIIFMCKGHFWGTLLSLWKGLCFPCSPPTVILGTNLRAQLPSTPHQWWSMDGRTGNGPRTCGTRPRLRSVRGSTPGLEPQRPSWDHAFLKIFQHYNSSSHFLGKSLEQCFSKCGPWTAFIRNPWERLAKDTDSQVFPQTFRVRLSGGGFL